jgi:hypothetical protein
MKCSSATAPSQDDCVCTAASNKNTNNKNMRAEKDNSIKELRGRLDYSIPGGYKGFFLFTEPALLTKRPPSLWIPGAPSGSKGTGREAVTAI